MRIALRQEEDATEDHNEMYQTPHVRPDFLKIISHCFHPLHFSAFLAS